MKSKGYILFLPLLALVPLFVFRDYTPDNELRYISIIEEALRDNHFFTFYNQGEIYADKPPLYFWLLMACRQLTGENILPLIALFTLIPCWVIFRTMNRLSGLGNEPTPVVMLLATVMFLGAAVVVRMDMLMVMFIVLALAVFYRMYIGAAGKYDCYLFPLYLFLALFSKGPVGILVPLASVAAFLIVNGRLKTFGRFFGWRTWSILLLLTGIWLAGVLWEGGTEYIYNLVFKQTIGRGINSFHHKEPIYYYLKTVWYAVAPWSLVWLVVTVKGLRKGIFQQSDILKFYCTIVLTTFLLLSLISSKIDIYLLPAYPFLIYSTYLLLKRLPTDYWIKGALLIPYLALAISPLSLFFIDKLLPQMPSSTWLIYITVGLFSVGGIGGVIRLSRGMWESSIRIVATTLLAGIFMASFTIPEMNNIIGFRDLAKQGQEVAEKHHIKQYAFYQFRSGENMDVYLQTKLQPIRTPEELKTLKKTILFVRDKEIRRQEELRSYLDTLTPSHVGNYKIYTIK